MHGDSGKSFVGSDESQRHVKGQPHIFPFCFSAALSTFVVEAFKELLDLGSNVEVILQS